MGIVELVLIVGGSFAGGVVLAVVVIANNKNLAKKFLED